MKGIRIQNTRKKDIHTRYVHAQENRSTWNKIKLGTGRRLAVLSNWKAERIERRNTTKDQEARGDCNSYAEEQNVKTRLWSITKLTKLRPVVLAEQAGRFCVHVSKSTQ